MNMLEFHFCGATLMALGSGALWWPENDLLCVSDLHLGKSERFARRGAPPMPPYETRDTLDRLSRDMDETGAGTIVCLGDSFDDTQAASGLAEAEKLLITTLQAGKKWIWIEGNHDPGPVDLGGSHLVQFLQEPLVFRHIAERDSQGEVSGHYHPKARLAARGRSVARKCFLYDSSRLIMPAYGTYTGGLRSTDDTLTQIMQPDAVAILTGPNPCAIPMPR